MIATQIATQNPVLQLQRQLIDLIQQAVPGDGEYATAIDSLQIYQRSQPTEPLHYLDCVAFCIIVQGSKQVFLADQIYYYNPLDYIVLSVDLPIMSNVTHATPDEPFLGMRILLQPELIRDMLLEGEFDRPVATPKSGLLVNQSPSDLLDAAVRLLRLLQTPADIKALAPLALREITYRLLQGNDGARLRQLVGTSANMNVVLQAINWLKHNYSQAMQVDDLAQYLNVSTSSLHHLFKTVTAMSPLQYQKRLRLYEARRLMLEGFDAASASFEVGYQSPSQFTREYRRMFNAPPLRDLQRLKPKV
ncbi:AraC family transcriptional regulator [Herpetosiphon llansteffanensis]|uniref:AraC family transcriptional regulator n=1 Tax=Herpetosiphon llansteffanensis TaxID=2094568 RepID=UPI000D7C3409|nr:AraC family transcriptional regulator [Herpetosiphon llansteffanensis]